MGYFIKNHGKTDGPLINYQNNSQRIDPAAYYINMGANSIFGFLTMFNSDGQGGSKSVKDDSPATVDNKKKIEELQGTIDTKLKEANVADIADLTKNITASQEAQQSLQSDIKSLDGEISGCTSNLSDIQGQINELNKQLSSADGATKEKINLQLAELIENKKKVETEKNNLINNKNKLEENLKTEQASSEKLTAVKNEIVPLQQEMEQLKKQLSKEEQYDASKESSDLKALKNFTENPSKETAEALKKAYEDGDNSKTMQKGYEQAVKKYPQYFKE